MYLTRRKPGFDHDRFVARWREHGALAMSKGFFRNMRAYVQAEVIQPAVLPGTTQDFDAVAYIIMQEFTHGPAELEELKAMVADEHETFVGPIAPYALRVEERIITAGPPGGFTAFLFFLDPTAAMPVAEHYGQAGADRVILNTRPENRPSSRFPPRTPIGASSRYRPQTRPGFATSWTAMARLRGAMPT